MSHRRDEHVKEATDRTWQAWELWTMPMSDAEMVIFSPENTHEDEIIHTQESFFH